MTNLRSVALTLVFTIVFVGCTDSPTSESIQPQNRSKEGPGAKKNSAERKQPTTFSESDFVRTKEWIFQEFRVLGQIDSQGNEFSSQSAREAFLAKLKAVIGKEVIWVLPVFAITTKQVELESRFDYGSSGGNRKTLFLTDSDRDTFGVHGFLTVPIGAGITEDYARSLKRGDRITIRARITDVELTRTAVFFVIKNSVAAPPNRNASK